MIRFVRQLVFAFASIAMALSVPAIASAADPVTITGADTSAFPTIRFGFVVDSDSGELPDITLAEGTRQVDGVKVFNGRLGRRSEEQHGSEIMIAFDTSLSMKSPKIDDAIAAAEAMLDQARSGDKIGLVTFGGEAAVAIEPTSDLDEVRAALTEISLAENTTMFDAVALSAAEFGSTSGNRAIVIISDGKDLGSSTTLDEAISAAKEVDAAVWSVAIQPPGVEPEELLKLSNGTDGGFRSVSESRELAALFADLGRQLLRGYWLEYESTAAVAGDVQVKITAAGVGSTTTTYAAAPLLDKDGRAIDYTPPKVVDPSTPLVPLPGGTLGMLLAGLPFALLIAVIAFNHLQRRSRPDLAARLAPYVGKIQLTEHGGIIENDDSSGAKSLATPFLALWDRVLGSSGHFARIRFRAEQANIAIRPNELFSIELVGVLVGLFLGVVIGNPIVLIAAPLLMGYAPMIWLRMKARKRRKRFDEQLADMLGGVSSSLKAGHSFNQAINGVVKDAPDPMSTEFARVMAEARLGLPLDDAMQAMADRMGSPDFDFAVTTINIQRTVGGSLADILGMVGDTVRGRQQFRKKVKALVAMGQMSAYVLIGMPVFVAIILTAMRPDFMAPLYNTTAGHIMMATAGFSTFLGYLACMKIVKVKL